MESTVPLASLSLTHVHYNADDPLSYLCAWLALVPQTLCVIYVTLIWSSREAEILLMFIGQMGCEALNFLLKRIIKEERPKQMNGKGYGMPSSHAQFVAFFSLSLTLFLLLRHNPPLKSSKSAGKSTNYTNPEHYHQPLTMVQRMGLSLVTMVLATSVSLSRIYLDYHTPTQVLVGCGAGALSAACWFIVTSALRSERWVDWAINSWAGKVGRWRDLVVEEDLAEAGWKRWSERVQKKTGYSDEREGEGGKKVQ